MKLDLNNYLKDRAVCKNCSLKRKKNNNNTLIQNQQPKIDKISTKKINGTFLVGTSFSGKTYFLLRILSGLPDRDTYSTTKTTPEQYLTSQVKSKEIGEEVKHLNESPQLVHFLMTF